MKTRRENQKTKNAEGRQDVCPKHVLGTCSGTGQCQDSPNYYWADLDRTNSDKALKKARTRFYSLFGDDLLELPSTNCAMENALHCLEAAPV